MMTKELALYEARRDVTLTAYVLDDSPELLNGRKRPAILVCPGGAYLRCSAREAEPVALRFAAMGYHAFVLRYSTYSDNRPGVIPLEEVREANAACVFPAPMRDIGKAFLALRAHAEEWLVDMDRIAICGFSAGAHNCAMYSVNWKDPLICEHLGAPPALLKPAAAILGYGIGDYNLMREGLDKDPMARKVSEAASLAYFGTRTPDQAMLDRASPALHVTKDCPPTFLWATAADGLVPAENSTRMASALAKAGVPFELHVFERGPHGLSLGDQASAGSRFEIDADAARWVGLAETWLKLRFALELPEKPAWMAEMEAAMRADA